MKKRSFSTAEDRTLFSRNSRTVLDAIEAVASAGIQQCDLQQQLSAADFQDIVTEVIYMVFSVMEEEERTDLNDRDRDFINERTRRLTRASLPKVDRSRRRFAKMDRVVCKVGGQRGWAAGTVQAIDEDDPADPTGQSVLPYVVKVDPPNSRLISVLKDERELVRAEVCFGQRVGASWFTAMCLPMRRTAYQRVKPRFAQGERVA